MASIMVAIEAFPYSVDLTEVRDPWDLTEVRVPWDLTEVRDPWEVRAPALSRGT